MFQNNISAEVKANPRLLFDGRLEAIVKYHGDILSLENIYGVDVEILNSSYAIITGETENIQNLSSSNLIEYIELPKTLTYELSSSRYSVCATRAQNNPYSLTGKGTVIGIIDSGIDFTHPDFRNSDGTSRILYIWDQSSGNNPPEGFSYGSEYTKNDIDYALTSNTPFDTLPFRDSVGHGTAVAGVAAGNGSSSQGREKGIAPEASLIVVKLGRRGFGAFPRTTEVMRAFKYIIEKAESLSLPLSINLSYGTNNGSHDGFTLFEQFINDISGRWKTSVAVATGNEGSAGHHFSAVIDQNETLDIPIFVSGAPGRIYMTLWKNFTDDMSFFLISPTGASSPELIPTVKSYFFSLGRDNISVFNNQPTPYTESQELYILLESNDFSITEGIWTLRVVGKEIVIGQINIWLPTVEDVTNSTSFSLPSTNITLTLPSTAMSVISVGGYNAENNTVALFSGRGYTRNDVYVKPDIVSPAVNILTTRAGGGYMQYSGTSIGTPFVTGALSLMQEWGIVRGNDMFLYGQRAKAFLQKGAKRNPNTVYPNRISGYGALCISGTLDYLVSYTQGGFNL